MILKLVLNHHSLPFNNRGASESGILDFLSILKTCRQFGYKFLIIDDEQDASLMQLELSKDYFIRNWYAISKAQSKYQDWRAVLLSIETKQPLFEYQIDYSIEVGLMGENKGKNTLLSAYVNDTFLVSFATKYLWRKNHLPVWVYNLKEDSEEATELLNLYDNLSIEVHRKELEDNQRKLFNTANKIWKNRQVLFPNLTLLQDQIGKVLQNWSHRNDILDKARDSLEILDKFCSQWKNGDYPDYQHNYLRKLGLNSQVSGETTKTKSNPRYTKERLFWLPDGREVLCENHIKLPNGFRMHFYSDSEKKRIYVAYLGPHLKTSRFNS